MLNSDLDVLFSGPDAVDVTIGASSFKGLFDTPDDVVGDGMSISTEYVLTMKTSNVTTLEEYSELSVEGEVFKVRRIMKTSDGRLSSVYLSKE